MIWSEESPVFDDMMRMDRLLDSLHKDQLIETETLPSRSLPVEEKVSLGACLLRLLFAAVIRFSWLLWRLPALAWTPLYYPYVRYVLNNRIPVFVGLAAWLVLLADHDPLNFTTRGRPAGVRFTLADLYQLWYWLAAPILYRTAYWIPRLLRDIHAKAALDFNHAFDVGISLSDYVIECYKPTPPQTTFDHAFRLLLRETHLDKIQTNIQLPEYDSKSRPVSSSTDIHVHLGWDMYLKALKKRKWRRAMCHGGGFVVRRLSIGLDGQPTAEGYDENVKRRQTNKLVNPECYGTTEPNFLELASEKLSSKGMQLNDLPVPSTDRRVLIDDLEERCGRDNERKMVPGIPSPDLTVETCVAKGAELLPTAEILNDQIEEDTAYVRAPEKFELSTTDAVDEKNELTADETGEKKYAENCEAFLISGEEVREEPITSKIEHVHEQDFVAAPETEVEERQYVSKMDFNTLEILPIHVQILPSAEAQLTLSHTEQPQPIFEESRAEIRYDSEEIYESSKNESIPIEDHQINPDELQHDAQKSLPLNVEPNIALRSVPLALGNEIDLNETTTQGEMHNAMQIQLLPTSESKVALEDRVFSVGDKCYLFEKVLKEHNEEVLKEHKHDSNVVITDSILDEIISQRNSWPDSNDIDEDFVQLPEQIAQEDEDQATADLWEPEYQEDKMMLDIQEDCCMVDKTHLDVSRDSEWWEYDDGLDTVMEDIQESNFQPEMDVRQPIQTTGTVDSDQLVSMNLPEKPAPVTAYDGYAIPRPEEQFSNTVSEYHSFVLKPSSEKACVKTGDEPAKFVCKSCAQIFNRQPELSQHKEISHGTLNQEAEESFMAQVHPPHNPSMALSQNSHTKPESAEVAVIGNTDKVDRDKRDADLDGEKKIFSGNGDDLVAIQNPEVHKRQEHCQIIDGPGMSMLAPDPLNKAGFDTINGKSVFDFEEIQGLMDEELARELAPDLLNKAGFDTINGKSVFDFEEIQDLMDEELARELEAEYIADSDIQNVLGSVEESENKEDMVLHDCKDVCDSPISNCDIVDSTNSPDCPENPVMVHDDDIREEHDDDIREEQRYRTIPDDESEVDDEKHSRQRGKLGDIEAASPNELVLFASQPSCLDREDEPGQVPCLFSKASSDSSPARKSTPEQSVLETSVEVPGECTDESYSSETDTDTPKEPKDNKYRESVDPVAVDCPMYSGSPSQPIADPRTSIQRAQSPGLSKAKRLEKMKQAYMKAKRRPVQLFHQHKTRRAPSTPHETRSIGSTKGDEQLRSCDRMASLNQECSTSTSTTEGIVNTDQRRSIKLVPIAEVIAMHAMDKESENAVDYTRR